MSNTTGCLYVVATPIGNLSDITLRAIETLKSVDLIAAEDTRHSRKLLQHLAIDKPMVALHDHNEDVFSSELIDRMLNGAQIAIISDAGTPLISDPGFPLVRACRESNVVVVPIPGPSAVITALSVAGLPTDRFRFEGFVPRKQQARREYFTGLQEEPATMIFYESSHRVQDCVADMLFAFGGARKMVLARELTKLHETVLSDSIERVGEILAADDNQRRGEFVLMLAGAQARDVNIDVELDRCLKILLAEVPLKQAAALSAKMLGIKKNVAYQRALALKP